MIYLFSGEDNFESLNKAKELLNKISANQNLQSKIIEADEVHSYNSFLQEFDGIDMFNSNEKIILVKRIFENKELVEKIVENFDYLNTKNIIFWHDAKADQRMKLVKLIKEKSEFDKLKEKDIKNWTYAQIKKQGLTLNLTQVELLSQYCDFEKWRIFNEISKLKLYSLTKNSEVITDEELNNIVGVSISGDIWKFLEYFSDKNSKKAIVEFDKLTQFESLGQYIIAMILRELKILYGVIFYNQNNLDFKELKLHPFVLEKARQKSKKHSLLSIEDLLYNLLKLDEKIKLGLVEEKIGIIKYLNEIS